jgi:tight adherence protein B
MSVARARLACSTALAAGLVLAVAAPAFAAEGRIVNVSSAGGQLQVVFTATGLVGDETLDPASVQLEVNGVQIPGEAVPVDSTDTVTSTSTLVMDTSGSMAGDRLDTAKQAARAYLESVPTTVRVGLVTFADTAERAVAPTTNRAEVLRVIDSLQAEGDTALYDGTVVGVRSVGAEGARNILILSDGEDTGSQNSLARTENIVKSSRVVVDAVSIGTGQAQVGQLQRLTSAGRGQVVASDDLATVTAAFSSAARSVGEQVAVTANLPQELSGKSGNLTVRARVGEADVADTAFVTLPTVENAPAAVDDYGPQVVAEPTGLAQTLTQPWVLALAALLLFVGLAALLNVAFRTAEEAGSPERKVSRRLSIYTLTGRQPVKESETNTALGSSGVARSAVDFAGRVVAKRDFETVLGERLERAAVPLKPAEWLLIHVGATLGLGLLFLLLSGGGLIATMIGVAIGAIVPWAYLIVKESRRKAAFLAQMPETLQLIAGSLSSGYSLPQAIDAATRDAAPPISTELDRALVEARLGVPIEDALDGVAARMQSVDFSWVVMAIRIQREVGGNLSEILNTTAATLRERERLRRQVQVLSAEGRLSAWILGGLPIAFTIYLVLARGDYLEPLYTTLLGWALIILAVILMVVGIFWLRKSVKVEV